MKELAAKLDDFAEGASAEDLQSAVFAVGKANEFEPLRDWFKALYQVLVESSAS